MLKVEGLLVRYGAIAAVQDVSFEVEKGELVMILGRNGAGKSSLLKAIMGQVAASGKVILEGEDISRWPTWKRLRKGLSLVPEGRRVFSAMSVKENLELGGFSDPKKIKTRLEEVLELFPVLKEKLEIPAGALSGGEQQMLAIARALMSGPRYLLLDEPSMGLAPKIVDRIYETLERLQGELTLLVVEQNISQSLILADRVFFLDGGRLVKEFQKEELSPKEIEALYLGGHPE